MSIKRAVPNITTQHPRESRRFYTDFLGFDVAMDMNWIVTLASPRNPSVQVSLIVQDDRQRHQPDISVEVGNVDEVHDRAVAQGITIAYPLTDEPWGVRRFMALDPNGLVVNILSHL